MKYLLFVLMMWSVLPTHTQAQSYMGGQSARTRAMNLVADGDNRLKLADLRGAIFSYTNAIQIDPSYADAYMKRAIAYTRMRQDTEAMADYNYAIQLNPHLHYLYDERAKLKMLLFDYVGAITDIDRSLQLNPQNLSLADQKAEAKAAMEDYQGAIQEYTTLITANSDDTISLLNRALLYLQTNELNAAFADIERALAVNPQMA
ncbi:MAG TPA: tetratricopeptide repeat protein, partial [Chitinophagales bacterium]|nr:tetratricopeptide repeat protein [Chitinophagales bacterium]